MTFPGDLMEEKSSGERQHRQLLRMIINKKEAVGQEEDLTAVWKLSAVRGIHRWNSSATRICPRVPTLGFMFGTGLFLPPVT